MLSGYCGTKAAVDALSEALRIWPALQEAYAPYADAFAAEPTLDVAVADLPRPLGPWVRTPADDRLTRLLYRPILAADDEEAMKGERPGQLAEALEPADLGRKLVIRLRSGVLWSDGSREVTALVARVLEVARRCDEERLFGEDTPMLTAGGSAVFDLVIPLLRAQGLSRPMQGVLRSGCYITHDNGNYARFLKQVEQREGLDSSLRAALEVWADGAMRVDALPQSVQEAIRGGLVRPAIEQDSLRRARAQAVELKEGIRAKAREAQLLRWRLRDAIGADLGANCPAMTGAFGTGG